MKLNLIKKVFAGVALSVICFTNTLGAIPATATNLYASEEPVFGNYFNSDYDTRAEVIQANRELNVELEGEGLVLLKNDSSLPIDGELKVSVFGKSSVNMFYHGNGSGAGGNAPVTDLIQALNQEGFKVNSTLVNFYKDSSKSGSGRGTSPSNGAVSAGYNTGETPVSYYTADIEATYEEYGDAAIVVFSRVNDEGWDLPRTSLWNGSTYSTWGSDATKLVPGARQWDDHYLQLDQNESDLLKYLGEHFDNVIVLLNTASQFEVGFLDDPGHYGYHENVKGCIWMGYPGSSGNVAVAKALKGEINPSGKTIDTWSRDFKNDPTWQNFGNNLMEVNASSKGNQYTNLPKSDGLGGGGYENNYVIYKEGIYLGYRYYETRDVVEGNVSYSSAGKGKADVVYNSATGKDVTLSADKDGDNEVHGTTTTEWNSWYDSQVVYPFGYGLSYTTFEWELVDFTPENNGVLASDSVIRVAVKVTNSGSVAGKDVVQLYYTAPYYNGGIEKAHVVLAGFAKTKLIQPGESDTVYIELKARDMSSYDWSDANGNGFKGYELESGTYEIKLMKDAHTVVTSFNCVVKETIKYQYSEATGSLIENRFDDVSNYLLTDKYANDGVGYMSRSDFSGTIPTMAFKLTASQDVINGLNYWDVCIDSPDQPWYTDVMPNTSVKNGLMLQDLIGVEYDDPKWDLFMDQFSVSQLEALAMRGGMYAGQDYPQLGVVRSVCADGPAGFGNGAASGATYSLWCSGTMISATYNVELARAYGVAAANEALWGNGSVNIVYWYGPAANIHRSPFSGRNFEYFGEDGYASGIIGAAVVDGAQSKGLIPIIKHFALNDQETNRCGLITRADEQTMREIYFKPFELFVTEGGTMGMMSSLNKIGTEWAGGSYRLQVEVLREEWGFNGVVITDAYSRGWGHPDMTVRGGGNVILGTGSLEWGNSSPTAVLALRNASKGLLYAMANSMAMNTGSSPAAPRPISSFATTSLATAVVNINYQGSVASAHINPEAYPDASDSEIIYTLKEGSVLPDGLTLNPDGSISGTPVDEIPYANFTVVATYAGYSKEATFTLSIINSAGSIVYNPVSTNLALAGVGKNYSVSVADALIVKPDATQDEIDKFPKITYSLADGSALPRGLTLNTDGSISGTATIECENYEITIVASALGYKDRYVTYTISIYNDLTFVATEIENAKFGEDYVASIATAECVKDVTYTLKDGCYLPKGLVLGKSGYIVGKPMETVTDYEFTVVASAPYAQSVEATFKISVGVTFDANVSLANGTEGSEYVSAVSANGAGDIKYRLKDGSELPEGLELSENGQISGTPNESGTFKFTVIAEADGKVADEIELTLFVANKPVELTWWQKFLQILAQLFGIK